MKQLFPILPLHRLNERPTRRAVIADLTCDSDGKMDQFIELRDVKSSLELHTFDGRPYHLGVFLVGAYQEILGDLHNLFGDTNAVHIALGENGYRIDHVVEGDSVTQVLGYVQYQKQHLVQRMRQANEVALRRGLLTFEESALLMRRYDEGLSGYTYLEEEDLATRIENGTTGLTAAPPLSLPEAPLVPAAQALPEPPPAAPDLAPRRRKRAPEEGGPQQGSFLPGQER